jgi:type IV secretory pathway VirB2 component (pilin)
VRIRSAVSLASLAAVVAGIAPTAVAATSPASGSAYPWAQPGTAAVTTQWTQPPASVPIASSVQAPTPGPDFSYRWAQPWEFGAAVPMP